MKALSKTAALLLLLAALVLVNILGSLIPWRLDLTEDNLYTLSEGSENLLQDLDEPVELRLYFSRSAEGVPVNIKNFGERVADFLRQYALASGEVTLTVVDPEPDTDEEQAALRAGLESLPMPNGTRFFLGLHVIQADQEVVAPFIDWNREAFLEYDLSRLIYEVQQLEKPTIGIISGLDVLGSAPPQLPGMPPQQGGQPWIFVDQLRELYNVVDASGPEIGEDVDLLFLLHPQGLSPAKQYAIDQFLLSGKPVLAAIDPASTVQLRGLSREQLFSGGGLPSFNSELETLLSGWGIAFEPTDVVADVVNAEPVQAERGGPVLRFPIWVSLKEFASESPATAELENVLLVAPGAYEVRDSIGLEHQRLLVSSDETATLPNSRLLFTTPERIANEIEAEAVVRTFAGIVRGEFATAFPGGPPPSEDEEAPPPEPGLEAGESTLVVVADSDFLFDSFAVEVGRNLFGQTVARPLNDNLAFATNLIDLATGSSDLISVRSKGTSQRPFTVVEAIQRRAQEQYQESLDRLEEELQTTRAQIQELRVQQRDTATLLGSPELQEKLRAFELRESEIREEQREIRKQLRADIEALDLRLAVINLLTIPALIAIGGLLFFARRSRRKDR